VLGIEAASVVDLQQIEIDMPLYDRAVRELFKDFVSEAGLAKETLFSRKDVVSWFSERYPKVKKGTISAHLLMLSTNAPSRIHYNPRVDGQDDLFYQLDSSHFRLYEPLVDPTPIRKTNETRTSATEAEIEDEIADDVAHTKEFAYERDLKNYLSKNLSIIESGLGLYEEEGISGLEFPVGGRFIDILALDKHNNYVVVELKVSRGYDRVIGQLLRYMAWIEKNQADANQRVRGIIVAGNISEDLILAASRLGDVELFEYNLAMTLRRIK
jgi:endonuclease NucS-like protein